MVKPTGNQAPGNRAPIKQVRSACNTVTPATHALRPDFDAGKVMINDLQKRLRCGSRCPRISRMSSEPLVVEFEERGVLRLRGPLTTENLPPFQNAVRREDSPTLFLDLTDVPYMDSAGLGSLVSAYTSLQKLGRRVILTGVNERVAKLFEITRVEQLFLMFPDLHAAIEALTSSGTA